MSNDLLAIVVMLVSSAMYALSFVLQHKGTQQAIGLSEGVDLPGEGGSAGFAKLLRNPTYLVGVVLFGLSFLVHLVALGLGAVAIVQPLIVTELIFIPPFAAIISGVRVTRRQWAAILAVCVGLAVFIVVASPSEGSRIPSTAEWIALLVGCAVLIGLLMGIGRRQHDSVRAALFGVAAGLVNALLALVAKGAFEGDHESTSDWLTDPLVWLTVVMAVLSVVAAALAFRAGPITSSTPAMISVNPVASTLVAMWLFGENINTSLLAIAVILVCVVVVIGGVYVLSQEEAAQAEAHAGAA